MTVAKYSSAHRRRPDDRQHSSGSHLEGHGDKRDFRSANGFLSSSPYVGNQSFPPHGIPPLLLVPPPRPPPASHRPANTGKLIPFKQEFIVPTPHYMDHSIPPCANNPFTSSVWPPLPSVPLPPSLPLPLPLPHTQTHRQPIRPYPTFKPNQPVIKKKTQPNVKITEKVAASKQTRQELVRIRQEQATQRKQLKILAMSPKQRIELALKNVVNRQARLDRKQAQLQLIKDQVKAEAASTDQATLQSLNSNAARLLKALLSEDQNAPLDQDSQQPQGMGGYGHVRVKMEHEVPPIDTSRTSTTSSSRHSNKTCSVGVNTDPPPLDDDTESYEASSCSSIDEAYIDADAEEDGVYAVYASRNTSTSGYAAASPGEGQGGDRRDIGDDDGMGGSEEDREEFYDSEFESAASEMIDDNDDDDDEEGVQEERMCADGDNNHALLSSSSSSSQPELTAVLHSLALHRLLALYSLNSHRLSREQQAHVKAALAVALVDTDSSSSPPSEQGLGSGSYGVTDRLMGVLQEGVWGHEAGAPVMRSILLGAVAQVADENMKKVYASILSVYDVLIGLSEKAQSGELNPLDSKESKKETSVITSTSSASSSDDYARDKALEMLGGGSGQQVAGQTECDLDVFECTVTHSMRGSQDN